MRWGCCKTRCFAAPSFFCTHGAPPESVKNCFCPFKSAKKRRTQHSCKIRAFTSTEGFGYRSYLWVREIPPQTYDWGDNLARALPWVTGYRSYKSYKSYRHWLVMTLTSVASARRGWLMAPLPNLTLRFSQLEAAASYFGVDVRPRSVRSTFAGGLLRPLWLAVSVSGHFCHWSIQAGCVKTTKTPADCQPARGCNMPPWR